MRHGSNMVNESFCLLFSKLLCKVMLGLLVHYGSSTVEYICTIWEAFCSVGSYQANILTLRHSNSD